MLSVKTLGSESGSVEAVLTRPRRPRGLVPEVVDTLAADMREGRLQTGDKLPTESELMGRFEVSRTVVREAISRLQASGLVETRHGIGTFVMAPPEQSNFRIAPEDFATVSDVISLLELRISLESEAASLAAQRRDDSHLQNMASALAAFEASIAESSDAVPSDFQFHMEVARATGKPPLCRPHDLPGHHDHSAHPHQHSQQRTRRPAGLPAARAHRTPEHLQRHQSARR